jgi:hypothetical protein
MALATTEPLERGTQGSYRSAATMTRSEFAAGKRRAGMREGMREYVPEWRKVEVAGHRTSRARIAAEYTPPRQWHSCASRRHTLVVEVTRSERRKGPRGREPVGAEASETAVLRREGEYWSLGFAGQTISLRDTRGVCYLVALLRAPGHRLHAVDLRAGAGANRDGRRGARAIEGEPERARLAVTKGIKSALARVARAHPALGRHLMTTVRCGYFCSYLPDPRHPIRWGA